MRPMRFVRAAPSLTAPVRNLSTIPALRLRSRDKVMPIIRYFIVTGAILFGFLYLADAQLPPPGSPPNSSVWHGLASTPVPERASVPTLTVRSAPAPDMASAAVLAAAPPPSPATTASVATPEPAATPNHKPAAKPDAAKKPKRVVRSRPWRDDYALANPWAWRSPTRYW